MKKSTLGTILASAAMLLAASAAKAEEIKLIFTTITPPTSDVSRRLYHPWADRINEQGRGLVSIDVRDGMTLVSSANFYDRVLNDVVQITFGSFGYIGGKFPLSEILGLPFVVDSAEQGAVAYWRLYKSGALDSELGDLAVLYVIDFPQGALHFAKPPASLDNLGGLKIVASSKTPSEVVRRLGATPLSATAVELYQTLQRGTADGLIWPWSGFPAFKLAEVTGYHVEASLGGAPGAVMMARKKYDALPAAVRKVIDDNSGEAQSRAFGALFDQLQSGQLAAIKASPNHKVVAPAPAQLAAWKAKAEPVIDDWKAATPGGAKLLETFRALLADAKAGK